MWLSITHIIQEMTSRARKPPPKDDNISEDGIYFGMFIEFIPAVLPSLIELYLFTCDDLYLLHTDGEGRNA